MSIYVSFWVLMLSALLIPLSLKSQTEKKPEKLESFPYIYALYGFQMPGGDLADVYGAGNEAGGGAGFKTKTGCMLGLEASVFFGGEVKQNTLQELMNSDNQITNMYGEPGSINMRQTGFKVMGTLGKIFPVFGSNSNSGIFIRGNMGLLQHKIYIESVGNNIPQLSGDYVKGYDRLSNGLMIGEFVGWQNFSKNGAYHFILGFEFTQAFTENRRDWDYATYQKIDGKRLDLMYALKLGYYIPFRQKQSTGYFYY
jgi:hypothetical protein